MSFYFYVIIYVGDNMYKEALNILNILENRGYSSYIVGGFVRDRLLGIDSDDIDIITSATPDEISNIFNIEIKDNYGSIKLNYNNYNFDVTTFRKEFNYSDNRRPSTIEFVKDVKEDLKRRDFTINAILIDKNGNYIDYVNGIEDLNNKVLRSISSIKEDALRILRAIRFKCLYNFNFSSELNKDIKENINLIHNLSFDRIKQELNIIFNASKSNVFFNIVEEYDLYKTLEIEPINTLKETGNYLSVWAQLNYSNKYNFSNKEKKCIEEIKENNR